MDQVSVSVAVGKSQHIYIYVCQSVIAKSMTVGNHCKLFQGRQKHDILLACFSETIAPFLGINAFWKLWCCATDKLFDLLVVWFLVSERGHDPFDILPEGWLVVTHNSGMPVYLHRQSRVCTLAQPYFLGSGSARVCDIQQSAFPQFILPTTKLSQYHYHWASFK